MTQHERFSDRVTVAVTDRIAHVELDRPDKLNAIDPAMFEGLHEAGQFLAARDDVRAVVLSGRGRMFCAGLDFGSFAAMAGDTGALDPLEKRTHGLANMPQQACLQWRDLPVPVIAAIQGGALGGGLQIALGADIRLVTKDARLSIAEIRWGLVPDMGGCVVLPGLMREDQIRELTYTGRDVAGSEAVLLGLATRIADDPVAEAFTLATRIAGQSPSAMRAAKRLLTIAASADPATVLMAESREQSALMGNADQVEAVMAHLEKRAPVFD
ncbi:MULTISPECIES: crotonase/enoyl-CoA hydratase family protein [Maricaulis]|jgi:enoyl-CoA hydratase/carnithine racemase|uniref:crotonase/enoyl-CoA hydratase family protein n=1 Tax=Maricaulis TaxID=74317 RepID=UPI000C56DC14|nr:MULTISPECIES: crotonase/enoyl-CoA hydratase family protein [Maricaulis]MAC87810.1 enoyl-CoA hydratase [Maricaulis sp.]